MRNCNYNVSIGIAFVIVNTTVSAPNMLVLFNLDHVCSYKFWSQHILIYIYDPDWNHIFHREYNRVRVKNIFILI